MRTLSSRLPGHGPGVGAGFTLIEVLIALVILSTGIVLVLRAFDTSIVALSESRDELRSDMLIREKLASVRSGGRETLRAAGGSRGSFDPPYQQYLWETEVDADPQGRPGVSLVTVTVWRSGTGLRRSVATLLKHPEEDEEDA
ncbi:prepilin-type N-terminal cleavage/methylation domain-containing protein [Verrucomicrobiota bacterium]